MSINVSETVFHFFLNKNSKQPLQEQNILPLIKTTFKNEERNKHLVLRHLYTLINMTLQIYFKKERIII